MSSSASAAKGLIFFGEPVFPARTLYFGQLSIAMIELVRRHPYSMLMATAADELVSRDRTVNRYGRPLGRVVDSGLDPVELIEPLADTRRA